MFSLSRLRWAISQLPPLTGGTQRDTLMAHRPSRCCAEAPSQQVAAGAMPECHSIASGAVAPPCCIHKAYIDIICPPLLYHSPRPRIAKISIVKCCSSIMPPSNKVFLIGLWLIVCLLSLSLWLSSKWDAAPAGCP